MARFPFLWKSGDRYTLWSRAYSYRASDGSTSVITIEKVRVRFPSRQHLMKTEFGVRVVPSSVRVISRKTGKAHHNTTYYTLSESFHGGPGSGRDPLGGFASGRMWEVYEPGYRRHLAQLRKQGFTLEGRR